MSHIDESRTAEWKVELLKAPATFPVETLAACCCAPCFSWRQRTMLLGDAGVYKCMNGAFPCIPGELSRPFLIAEVCCCGVCSIAANRNMVMEQGKIKNTEYDNFIHKCADPCAPDNENGRCLRHCLYCLACPVICCMQSQQQAEVDAGTLKGESVVPPPATETMA